MRLPAALLVAFLLVPRLVGAAEGELPDTGASEIAASTIVSMAGIADTAGVDSTSMLAIMSVIDDARRIVGKESFAFGGPDVLLDPGRERAGGVFGYSDRKWLDTLGREFEVLTTPAAVRRPGSPLLIDRKAGEQALLMLRNDPRFSMRIAARAMRRAVDEYSRAMGRAPCPGEMLSLHLFGVDATRRMVQAAHAFPKATALSLLGPRGRDAALRPYVLDPGGRPLAVRGWLISSELLMARKRPPIARFLERFSV